MSVRKIVYPNEYGLEVVEGGDIRLRFNLATSRFGPVEIVLTAEDAGLFADELDKAIAKSDAMLQTEEA